MKRAIGLMLLAALTSTADAQTSFYKCKDKWGQPGHLWNRYHHFRLG